jgi:hypothetical protein
MAKNALTRANKLSNSATGLFEQAVSDLHGSNSAIEEHKTQINTNKAELEKNYQDALAAYNAEIDAANATQRRNSALAAKLTDFVTV